MISIKHKMAAIVRLARQNPEVPLAIGVFEAQKLRHQSPGSRKKGNYKGEVS